MSLVVFVVFVGRRVGGLKKSLRGLCAPSAGGRPIGSRGLLQSAVGYRCSAFVGERLGSLFLAEEAKANKGRAKTTEKRGKVKESSTATGNGSKRTRDRLDMLIPWMR